MTEKCHIEHYYITQPTKYPNRLKAKSHFRLCSFEPAHEKSHLLFIVILTTAFLTGKGEISSAFYSHFDTNFVAITNEKSQLLIGAPQKQLLFLGKGKTERANRNFGCSAFKMSTSESFDAVGISPKSHIEACVEMTNIKKIVIKTLFCNLIRSHTDYFPIYCHF